MSGYKPSNLDPTAQAVPGLTRPDASHTSKQKCCAICGRPTAGYGRDKKLCWTHSVKFEKGIGGGDVEFQKEAQEG